MIFIPPIKYIFLKTDLKICILLILSLSSSFDLFSKIKSFLILFIKLYLSPYGLYKYIIEGIICLKLSINF